MIYTSYFSSRKYDISKGVSVARYVAFKVADTCPELYPSEDLLKWWKSLPKEFQDNSYCQDMYKKRYCNETLNKLDVHTIAKKLQGKVLLCYEKSGAFCHRHIIAEWLNINGYDCEEIK